MNEINDVDRIKNSKEYVKYYRDSIANIIISIILLLSREQTLFPIISTALYEFCEHFVYEQRYYELYHSGFINNVYMLAFILCILNCCTHMAKLFRIALIEAKDNNKED